MSGAETDKMKLFEQFIDLYYTPVVSAIARLTGLSDEKKIQTIAENVFADLWEHRDLLFDETRPPAFTFKILLQQIFAYLQKNDLEEHLLLLQNILLIDPSHLAAIPDPNKKPFKTSLLKKIRALLK